VGLVLAAGIAAASAGAGTSIGFMARHRHAPARDPAESKVDRLAGMWSRYDCASEGDPVRFWYFHGDGHGLYRYGQVGLNYTQSFDYRVDGERIELRFRKSGEVHQTILHIEDHPNERKLSFADDPRESGASYHWTRGPLGGFEAEEVGGAGLGDHLWIDYRTFATGGAGFRFYQLAEQAIDGRGIGWFHLGDFDEWSTESLAYRQTADRIEFQFPIRAERHETGFEIRTGADPTELSLAIDPRDYGLSHRYADGGRSFGHVSLPIAELATAMCE
jgi:hypothetical protein